MITSVCYLKRKGNHTYLVFDAVKDSKDAWPCPCFIEDGEFKAVCFGLKDKHCSFAISKEAKETLFSILDKANNECRQDEKDSMFGLAKEKPQFFSSEVKFFYRISNRDYKEKNYRLEVDLDSPIKADSLPDFRPFFDTFVEYDNAFLASLDLTFPFVDELLDSNDALLILQDDSRLSNCVIDDYEIDGEYAKRKDGKMYFRKVGDKAIACYSYINKEINLIEYTVDRGESPFFNPSLAFHYRDSRLFTSRIKKLSPDMIGISLLGGAHYFIEARFLISSDEEFEKLCKSHAKSLNSSPSPCDPSGLIEGTLGLFEFTIKDGHVDEITLATVNTIEHRYGYGSREEEWECHSLKLSSCNNVHFELPDWVRWE